VKFKSLVGGDKSIKKPYRYVIKWDGKSRSKFQFGVKQYLKQYWKNDIVFEEFPVVGTALTIDFYNHTRRIAVEAQGGQHERYVSHFHGKHNRYNFLRQLKRDQRKLDFCELNNITMVEIYYKDELCEELFSKQGVEL